MTFTVNYGKVKPDQITEQQMLILEPDNYNHIELVNLKKTGAKLIGYVSLGEVNPERWYYPLLKDRGFLGKNKNWNSYYINLADSVSRDILIDKVIPDIIKKGFDGLFLDTIDDVAPYTGHGNLQPYMVQLIKEIHKRYPKKKIIQNAGLFLLDKTRPYIDGVLIEDVATRYQFKNKEYILTPETEYHTRVDTIQSYKTRYHIPFYIVDYSDNPFLKKEITSRLDTLDIPFYIGNINLN